MQANALKCYSSTVCRHFPKSFDDYEFGIRYTDWFAMTIRLRGSTSDKGPGPRIAPHMPKETCQRILGNSYNLRCSEPGQSAIFQKAPCRHFTLHGGVS